MNWLREHPFWGFSTDQHYLVILLSWLTLPGLNTQRADRAYYIFGGLGPSAQAHLPSTAVKRQNKKKFVKDKSFTWELKASQFFMSLSVY